MELGGLHHVTAVTAAPSRNVAFYTQILGMRLVKKTVNQDDVSAYHLFYGDELGRAGTEMTFFDWNLAQEQAAGAGTVAATAFRVSGRDALMRWAARLDAFGVPHDQLRERSGRAVLAFKDPEGQSLELVDDSVAADRRSVTPGTPWSLAPVPQEDGIRGLASVTLYERQLDTTIPLMTRLLGFRQEDEYMVDGHRAVLLSVGPGGPGAEVVIQERPDLPLRRTVGAGGVHHVAFRTATDQEHAAWRQELSRAGVGVTEVIDRFYFKSIYFREPGGVLFEIATDGPGFATDEDAAHLGEALSLPPFLQPHRSEIEAGLKPIVPVGAAALR